MAETKNPSISFEWLPKALEQLNNLHEKAPLVVNSCLLMLCAAPLVAAFSLPLFATRKRQDNKVTTALKSALTNTKD
ncbi:hypothetical protein HWV01_16045 [Moritella sp. 5]|uniref:hypothetical protein n=1 Tax=Moritella sp. 5 TaxID=2746231 RepID=UPI001BACECCC|nr:hypothetical protein [Moritella sp. 5]QUM81685.1 hypothetical protein HWV01_16045 [Moritella sp. 5]